jgi:CDGSH-type Zn-finger protein
MVRITAYRDGPLLVRGDVVLTDADGAEIDTRRSPLALCRCGKSRLRPFCDGQHKVAGFSAPCRRGRAQAPAAS